MYNDIIKLVKKTLTGTDEYGDPVFVLTERVVFAEAKSIGQQEFYQAQATGLKPELKFVIADYYDYQGESFLKHKDHTGVEQEYSIIRTYRNGNSLEITCKRGVD